MELNGLIEWDLECKDEPLPAIPDTFMAMHSRAVKIKPVFKPVTKSPDDKKKRN
jgi:hypothetical protein